MAPATHGPLRLLPRVPVYAQGKAGPPAASACPVRKQGLLTAAGTASELTPPGTAAVHLLHGTLGPERWGAPASAVQPQGAF